MKKSEGAKNQNTEGKAERAPETEAPVDALKNQPFFLLGTGCEQNLHKFCDVGLIP